MGLRVGGDGVDGEDYGAGAVGGDQDVEVGELLEDAGVEQGEGGEALGDAPAEGAAGRAARGPEGFVVLGPDGVDEDGNAELRSRGQRGTGLGSAGVDAVALGVEEEAM